MSDRSRLTGTATLASAARIVLGAVLTLLIAGPGTAAAMPSAGWPAGIVAQAGDPVDEGAAPRLQPVGNGDTIGSPDETDEASGPDRGTWWRIAFGAALAVVVLFALIQRRQTPERGRRVGSLRMGRRGDRNAIGR